MTPFPSVALTISLAPLIQFLLRFPLSPPPPDDDDVSPSESCRVKPLETISKQTPDLDKVEIIPRLRGKGKRGEIDGSRVIRVGECAEGGDKERATWENEVSVVGETESKVVD
jgi:hypothetical protein